MDNVHKRKPTLHFVPWRNGIFGHQKWCNKSIDRFRKPGNIVLWILCDDFSMVEVFVSCCCHYTAGMTNMGFWTFYTSFIANVTPWRTRFWYRTSMFWSFISETNDKLIDTEQLTEVKRKQAEDKQERKSKHANMLESTLQRKLSNPKSQAEVLEKCIVDCTSLKFRRATKQTMSTDTKCKENYRRTWPTKGKGMNNSTGLRNKTGKINKPTPG